VVFRQFSRSLTTAAPNVTKDRAAEKVSQSAARLRALRRGAVEAIVCCSFRIGRALRGATATAKRPKAGHMMWKIPTRPANYRCVSL
jgi:hypothetical protein